MQFNKAFIAYSTVHVLARLGMRKLPYNHKNLMPFRFGKYLALGAWGYSHLWAS